MKNNCLICQKETINPKFCGSSCAAKYNNVRKPKRTTESKLKTSLTLKKTILEQKVNGTYQGNKNKNRVYKHKISTNIKTIKTKSIIQRFCVQCNNQLPRNYYNKTCSRKCFSEAQSKRAIKQLKKGRGRQGYYKGIYCNSIYELVFVIYNLDLNKNIKRCVNTYFYKYKNLLKRYTPDFIIENQIYEIKGWHTFLVDIKLQAAEKQGAVIKLLYEKDLEQMFNYVVRTYKISKHMFHTLYDNYKPKFLHVCKNCNRIFENDIEIAVFCSRYCCGKHNIIKAKLSVRNYYNQKTKTIELKPKFK